MSKARHRSHKVKLSAGMGIVGAGKADEGKIDDVYSGKDSPVVKDAERRKRGGKVESKKPMHMEGKEPRHTRLDRPGRKRGGAVGADTKPFSAAHKLDGASGSGMYGKLDGEDD